MIDPARAFAHEELRAEPRLRWLCAALLLFFWWTFDRWYAADALAAVPAWPFAAHPLPGPGAFWTRAVLALSGLLSLAGLFLLALGRTAEPMLLLAGLFVVKSGFYLSDFRLTSNVHHTHLLLTLVFLVSRSKLFFARLLLLEAYLLAATAKLNPSWLLGEYLNSLPGKLPLAPKAGALVAAASAGLVLWELAGPWLWLARRRVLRDAATWVFAGFHLFSITMIGPEYPLLMLPAVLVAFWRLDAPLHGRYRYSASQLPAWTVLGAAALGGLWHFAIPGDARLTGEGRYSGLHFTETNRSADLSVEIEKGGRMTAFDIEWPWSHEDERPAFEARLHDGGKLVETLERPTTLVDGETVLLDPAVFTSLPPNALEPYPVYAWAAGLCRRYRPDRLGIRFRLSLDGHPDRVPLIDAESFCAEGLSYRPFGRNPWLRLPGPQSPRSYRWP